MATKAELRDRAAEALGILPVGQTLGSAHATRVEAGYDEVYADLKTEGLNTWPSDGDCPDELNPYLAALIADSCLNTYPVSADRFQRIKIAASTAKREIRRLVHPEYESIDDPTDY